MRKIFPCSFTDVPLWSQILIGIISGILNLFASNLRNFLRLPLFLDTAFTMFASFYGCVSGIVAAFVYHLLIVIVNSNIFELSFIVCSLALVAVFRFFINKGRKVSLTDMACMLILMIVLITVEGGIISTVLFTISDMYMEALPTGASIFTLLTLGFPHAAAAILSRLPVNIADKVISLAFALGLYLIFSHCKRNAEK